jgi:phosphonatase-like hydrolase
MVSDRSGGDGTGPRLACIDMAGTCITDEGLVLSAFERALGRLGVPADATAMEYVRRTMGQSKIEVFTALLGEAELGRECTVAFEEEYAANAHAAALIPGTRETFTALRAAGCAIYLTTGFSALTRDLLITGLGLADLIDGALSPQDTAFGRGRPHADMIWTAVMATGTSAMSEVLVAGDTTSDMESGHRSGARHVIGVLTGTHDRTALSSAGATVVVDSIADIPALL